MKKRLAVIATMLMVAASMTACGSKADTTAKESIIDTESVEEVTEEPETEAVAEVTGTEEPESKAAEPETSGKLESSTTEREAAATTQAADTNTEKPKSSKNASGSKAVSNTTESSTGNNAAAQTTQTAPTTADNTSSSAGTGSSTPAHVHTWVTHEGSGHYETQVVREAWDEPIYEMREVTRCSTCNTDISSWSEEQVGDHIEAHILAGEDKGGYYSTGEKVQTGTKHHDAETKQVWVQDTAPYEQCSGCGATK